VYTFILIKQVTITTENQPQKLKEIQDQERVHTSSSHDHGVEVELDDGCQGWGNVARGGKWPAVALVAGK